MTPCKVGCVISEMTEHIVIKVYAVLSPIECHQTLLIFYYINTKNSVCTVASATDLCMAKYWKQLAVFIVEV